MLIGTENITMETLFCATLQIDPEEPIFVGGWNEITDFHDSLRHVIQVFLFYTIDSSETRM